MGFQLKGTPNKVLKVAANLDDVHPDKAKIVRVQDKKKEKEKKKGADSGKAD
jgi:hypothetical protein